MLGSEIGLESLGVDGDEGQILRQPIVQITRQPLSLRVQRSRRLGLAHLGMSPHRDRHHDSIGDEPQPVAGSDPIGCLPRERGPRVRPT